MSSCGGKKMEKGGKVITPQKEKERIRKMEKEARMKKAITKGIEKFGKTEMDQEPPAGFKKYGVGGAVAKGVKKLVSKMKGEKANPYKSTVGDSYRTRAKKQGEIEQSILKDNSIYKTKKDKDEALKTLSDRMKRERKETLKQKMGFKEGGMLKTPDNPGLKKLPTEVRNKMGYMKKGGKVYCKDGCAIKGKTKGKLI